LGLKHIAGGTDEYDSYLVNVIRILLSQDDVTEATNYLVSVERTQMNHVPNRGSIRRAATTVDAIRAALVKLYADAGSISLSSIVIPVSAVAEGALIKANALAWAAVVKSLRKDWGLAYQIPPYKWEEIIAAAFDQSDFDEVILTPRSGDHGRDVIAFRKGIGCIKIIGSVKAYKPGY
jgi:hypothetical protein